MGDSPLNAMNTSVFLEAQASPSGKGQSKLNVHIRLASQLLFLSNLRSDKA